MFWFYVYLPWNILQFQHRTLEKGSFKLFVYNFYGNSRTKTIFQTETSHKLSPKDMNRIPFLRNFKFCWYLNVLSFPNFNRYLPYSSYTFKILSQLISNCWLYPLIHNSSDEQSLLNKNQVK